MIGSKYNVTIQVCNSSYIANWEHIFFSALYAMLAFSQKRNISNQLSLEILLYLSAQRQIRVALEAFGLRSGSNVIIILGNNEQTLEEALNESETTLPAAKLEDMVNISDKDKFRTVKAYFKIGEAELDAIKDSDTQQSLEEAVIKALLNRIALVTLEK